jgi:hypothetical protein
MTKTTIKINCGCGEKFTTILSAETHAILTGHTLSIGGEIRGDKSLVILKTTKQ